MDASNSLLLTEWENINFKHTGPDRDRERIGGQPYSIPRVNEMEASTDMSIDIHWPHGTATGAVGAY